MERTWNNTGATSRRRATAKNYRTSDFIRDIEEKEARPRYTDFDFNSASVGGRYLKYAVENYGY